MMKSRALGTGACVAFVPLALVACAHGPLGNQPSADPQVVVVDGGAIVVHDAPIVFRQEPPASHYALFSTAAGRGGADDHDARSAGSPSPSARPDGAATPAPLATPTPGPTAMPPEARTPAGTATTAASATPTPVASVGFAMTYVAQTQPITVDGIMVQANGIVVKGDRAYIAYNASGEPFRGAMQVLDISNPERPSVVKTIAFPSLDVTALCVDGDRLLFGGGADPDRWPFRSFIGAVDLASIDADRITRSLHGLPSYTATCIQRTGERVYVGVGAKNGGVAVLTHDLATQAFVADPDVRGLAPYGDGVVALAGTTDSSKTASTLDLVSSRLDRQVSIKTALQDYSRANLAVVNANTVLVAASLSGLVGFDLRTADVPVYTLQDPGESNLVSTNGVAVQGNLAFVANGEYGFRVLDVSPTGSDAGLARVLGWHEMSGDPYGGQHLSANDVALGGDFLFVASGLGGVNVYHMSAPTPATPSSAPRADRDDQRGDDREGGDRR